MRVRTPDIIQGELKALHDTQLSWRAISSLSQYSGIPAGTLCSIAKTGEIPHRWRKRLGVQDYRPAPVCRCGEVHARGCQPGREMVELPTLAERPALLVEIRVQLLSRKPR